MRAVPLHLREANDFVAQHHQHNLPTVGGKFAVGSADDEGKLVGVAVAGRPVARRLDDGLTLEVLRVCTDGTPNACSFLYARCAKIARLMGYEKIITYTLASESGASLRAVGAIPTGPLDFHEWGNPNRPARAKTFTTSRSFVGNCELAGTGSRAERNHRSRSEREGSRHEAARSHPSLYSAVLELLLAPADLGANPAAR